MPGEAWLIVNDVFVKEKKEGKKEKGRKGRKKKRREGGGGKGRGRSRQDRGKGGREQDRRIIDQSIKSIKSNQSINQSINR